MNANTARRLRRNAAVLASFPVAMLLMTGTASAAGTSGDPSLPQPLSHADQNGTGANPGTLDGCGAYCSTRDGSPSQNGVSDNTQSNKPCAGCVGKADNKNPQGQAPSGPVDHNAGYECDRNQGIGQGNPAHTGCTTPVDTPPVDTPPVVVPPVVVPPVDTPPVVVPPVVNPPVVNPPVDVTVTPTGPAPVCTADGTMVAGAEASCAPATAGSGSSTVTLTDPIAVVIPDTAPAAPEAPSTATPVTTPVTTDPTTATPTDTDTTAGSGTVTGQSSDSPVVLGSGTVTAQAPGAAFGSGSAAAAQSPTGLPFTGDSTETLALLALGLLVTGGGLIVGARRV